MSACIYMYKWSYTKYTPLKFAFFYFIIKLVAHRYNTLVFKMSSIQPWATPRCFWGYKN